MKHKQAPGSCLRTNLHVHTPHSFSYFSSIEELVKQAKQETISVLGINDFDTWGGFSEFSRSCRAHGIFPSFGVEVMAISREHQSKGELVNDPRNPGRIYLCGKGIPFPADVPEFAVSLRERVRREASERMKKSVGLLNEFLRSVGAGLCLAYEDIEKTTASGWVRERHIARELARKLIDECASAGILENIFKHGSAPRADFYTLQEEIRSQLLKAGGKAYAPESEGAFLSLAEAKKLFLSLGGIPVYPVLADGAGEPTDMEKTPEKLCLALKNLGYRAVEFIPHRNKLSVLLEYAGALSRAGFLVTAGSEHNSPAELPLAPVAKDAPELPRKLLEIFSEGACCVCAHQARRLKGRAGFVDERGERTNEQVHALVEEGGDIIRRFIGDGA